MEQQRDESFWKECILQWYPNLHTQTYFFPPLHFNRVPYSEEKVADQTVYVPQTLDGSRQLKPSTQTVETRRPVILESDVRDDQAQERVLHSLRSLASKGQEVMMVVSQLQFGKYLRHPSYQAAASKLPVPFSLSKEYHRGDFDVLIIHSQHGLITGKIKSVGAAFRRKSMSESEEDVALMKKVKDGIKLLNKSEFVLKYLVSDLEGVNIIKTLMFPNIASAQLSRAVSKELTIARDLCHCLGVDDVSRAIELCFCLDQVPQCTTPQEVMNDGFLQLDTWWKLITANNFRSMPKHIYETLVSRFCGPATTVDVHCITSPLLQLRTEGDGVLETGNRMARFVLFPEQIQILTVSSPLAFLSGPPGTGKTLMLILKALTWLQEGNDVHVVSTWRKSRAAAFLIEHQLQKTLEKWKPDDTKTLVSKLHRHMYEFEKFKQDVKKAVYNLSQSGHQGCIYITADEAGPEDDNSHPFAHFCDLLLNAVHTVNLWAASLYHHIRPDCLKEITLTTPLRSPPAVIKEIERAVDIRTGDVRGYKVHESISLFAATHGPPVDKITHIDGQKNHYGDWPDDCEQCGVEVANIVKDLRVSCHDKETLLQYRDVLVLCKYPRDDIALVRGIRQRGVPVQVAEYWADDDVIKETALALQDKVTVTHWNCVRGLEKKVVFAMIDSFQSHRLQGVSRCSAKLVVCNESMNSDQRSNSSNMSYWKEYVRDWYPDLHYKTYFFPTRHSKGRILSVKSHEGKSVIVTQRTENTQKNRSVFHKRNTHSDRDFRFQSDVVLHCLHAIADYSQEGMMMFPSQLHFGEYNRLPCYTAAVTLFLDSNFRSQRNSEGEFSVLIIHNKHGLIIGEVISFQEDFAMLHKKIQDAILLRKASEAIKQLNKAEEVLRDLVVDFERARISKTLLMPNVKSQRLLSVVSRNLQRSQDLCQCLGVHDVTQAVKLCLCADMIPENISELDRSSPEMEGLWDWWKRTTNKRSKKISETTYEQLAALFCGSSATVRLSITPYVICERKEGNIINVTGERIVPFVLYPDQISILNTIAPRVYLVGPPGTGKTVILMVKALQWLQEGHDVYVVSTCTGSRAASYLIWHQLQKTGELWFSQRSSRKALSVHLCQFDLVNIKSIITAIKVLTEQKYRSQLHIISEEPVSEFIESSSSDCKLQFCEMLNRAVPELFMWMTTVKKLMNPSCFQVINLTTPLRSPTTMLNMMNATVNTYDVSIPSYKNSSVKVGHESNVKDIEHFESSHANVLPCDCKQCGQLVAIILSGIGTIVPKKNSGIIGQIHELNYSDVLVFVDDPHDDRKDSRGNVVSSASGLVNGLRACGLPVYVIERYDETVVSDMERLDFDKVTVTGELCALYLEWKVIINMSTQRDRHQAIMCGASRNTLHLIKVSDLTLDVTSNLQHYPEFHQRSYFLPPLHFNRVPYYIQSVSGLSVLVPAWERNINLCKPPSSHLVKPLKRFHHLDSERVSRAQNNHPLQEPFRRIHQRIYQLKFLYSMKVNNDSSHPESKLVSVKTSTKCDDYRFRLLHVISPYQLYNAIKAEEARLNALQTVEKTERTQPTRVLDYTLKNKISAEIHPRTLSLRVQPTRVFSHDSRVDNIRQLTLQIDTSSDPYQPNQRTSCQLELLPVVFDHDVREDKAQKRVLRGLRILTEKLKEPMFVISYLSLDNLYESSFNTDLFWLPRPTDLVVQYRHKKSDLLIIHNQHGLIKSEIISEGADFSCQMEKEEEKIVLVRAVERAVKRLNKLCSELNILLPDMQNLKNMKILMAPYLTSKQLLHAINSHPQVAQSLLQCLGVDSVNDAVQRCLCKDQLSSLDACDELPDAAFEELYKWWKQISIGSDDIPENSSQIYQYLVSRLCADRINDVSPRIQMKTEGEIVAEAGNRMTQLRLYQYQVNIVNKLTPKVLLSGPPGTGKRTMLYLKGVQWLRAGHDVHIVSMSPERRAVSFLLEHSLSQTELPESRSPKPFVHRYDFDGEDNVTLSQLEMTSKIAPLYIVSDEIRFEEIFETFCTKLVSRIPGVFMWAASTFMHNIPGWQTEEVTVALRLPPVVLHQVQRSEVLGLDIANYKVANVPAPTDGPVIKRLPHINAPGHSEGGFEDCEWCGHGISRVLKELHVNITDRGSSTSGTRLQYNDVVVLCRYPRGESQGPETSQESGLVRGLRDCHVPVQVVEKDAPDVDIRDMALAVRNKVTVAHWEKVVGLERKVVVMKECGGYENLLCASCCTSQLVIVD